MSSNCAFQKTITLLVAFAAASFPFVSFAKNSFELESQRIGSRKITWASLPNQRLVNHLSTLIITDENGYVTFFDFDDDGEFDKQSIVSGDLVIVKSWPRRGTFRKMEITRTDGNGLLSATYFLSSDSQRYELWRVDNENRRIQFAEDQPNIPDSKTAECKPINSSNLKSQVDQSEDLKSKTENQATSASISDLCGSRKEQITLGLQRVFQERDQNPRHVACLSKISKYSQIARELKASSVALMISSPKNTYLCSEDFPPGKIGALQPDGKIRLRTSWLAKTTNPEEVARVLFHELLHKGGITDEAEITKIAACCDRGFDQTNRACAFDGTSIHATKPDNDASKDSKTAEHQKKLEALDAQARESIDDGINFLVNKDKRRFSCVNNSSSSLAESCAKEVRKYFTELKANIDSDICGKDTTTPEVCEATKVYTAGMVNIKAEECGVKNSKECVFRDDRPKPINTIILGTETSAVKMKASQWGGVLTDGSLLLAGENARSQKQSGKKPGAEEKFKEGDFSKLSAMQDSKRNELSPIARAAKEGQKALTEAATKVAKQITVIDKAQAETKTPTAKAAPEAQRATKPERSAKAEAPPEERPKPQAKGRSAQAAAPVYVAAARTQQTSDTRTPATKQEEQTTVRSTTPRGSSESTTGNTGSSASSTGGAPMRATASSMTSQGPKLKAGNVEISPISVSAAAFGGSLGGETSGSRSGAAPAAQINPANFVRGTTPTMTASASMRVSGATDGGGGASAPISSGGGGGGGGSSGFLSSGGGSSGSAAASSRAGSDERSRPAEQQADTQVIMNRFAKRNVSSAGELKALIRDVAKEIDPATLLEQAWFESHCQSLNLHIVGDGKSCGKPNLPRRSIKSFLLGN